MNCAGSCVSARIKLLRFIQPSRYAAANVVHITALHVCIKTNRYYGRAHDGSPRTCGAQSAHTTTTGDTPPAPTVTSDLPNGSSEHSASRLALSAEEFTALLQHCGLLQAHIEEQQQQQQQQLLDKQQLLEKPLQNGALQNAALLNGGASQNGALQDTGEQ